MKKRETKATDNKEVDSSNIEEASTIETDAKETEVSKDTIDEAAESEDGYTTYILSSKDSKLKDNLYVDVANKEDKEETTKNINTIVATIASLAIMMVIILITMAIYVFNQTKHTKDILNKLDEISSNTDALASDTDAKIQDLNTKIENYNIDINEKVDIIDNNVNKVKKDIINNNTKDNKTKKELEEKIEEVEISKAKAREEKLKKESSQGTIVAAAATVRSINEFGNTVEITEIDDETVKDNPDPNPVPTGPHLTKESGTFEFQGHSETYYNLDMSVIVEVAHQNGIQGDYWVRSDGAKMLGNYIMCACDRSIHPYGSLVETSLGMGISLDTGGFIAWAPYNVDIACAW